MAGTLVITTLSDGTNSTSSTNCIQGSAKAWVRFDGSSAAINSAYNVSSITKVTTGTYTANFTSALPNTNYCCVFGQNRTSSNDWGGTTSFSTTSVGLQWMNQNNNLIDDAQCQVAIFST
jgi:hypothetical protein